MHSDLEFGNDNNVITNSKLNELIDNNYWFFDFDEIDPINKKLNGNLILGSQPHEIFPEKYILLKILNQQLLINQVLQEDHGDY